MATPPAISIVTRMGETAARTRWIIAGLLVVAICAVYFPVRGHEFVGYDDHPYIVQNPTITKGMSAEGLWSTFSRAEHANWIPLTTLSLQLNHAAHGLDPAGYLLTNVALHALTSALLFWWLAAMTGSTWRSGFVAGVFALHPLHVESVAWASERKDVLCGFFFVLTLLAYRRFVNQRSAANYALLALGLIAALLSKPMAVTLPFVLVLLDFWPLGRLCAKGRSGWPEARRLGRTVVEKLPLFALAGAAAVVTVVAQRESGNFNYSADLPLDLRVANVVNGYVAYLVDSFWPTGLAVFYPFPAEAPARWQVVAKLGLLLGTTCLALLAAPRRPYLAVGWLWFLGMLVPVAGIVHVGMQARADRYMYLPQIGLTIAFSWAAVDAFAARQHGRSALAAVAAVTLIALAAVSHQQVGHWRDSIALFTRAVAVTEENHLAQYNLGTALGQAGRIEEAEAHRAEALEIMKRAARARAER
jgi:hypothetical protein